MTQLLATEKLLSYTGRRLKERRVDENCPVRIFRNRPPKEPFIQIAHGGDVAGSYGYPAQTEAIVTVAFPNGDVVQWGCRLRANGVTHGGILAACLGEWARPFGDDRFGEARRQEARELIITAARERLGSRTPTGAVRMNGDLQCDTCGMKLVEHPMSQEYLDFKNEPYLNRLCDGQLVKL